MSAPRLVGWFADPVLSYMDGIAASGANSVSMGPYYVMATWSDSDVGSTGSTVDQLAGAAAYARSLGLQVVWKPIIDCQTYAGDPYTSGFRSSIDPTDIDAWMADYWAKCFEPFLGVCDVVAVHTELATISTLHPTSFISLIAMMRTAGFSGPVTTSHDLNPLACPYWAALDWIGGDAYLSIRSDTMGHAVADWTALRQQAEVAHAQTGCGIYFGELNATYAGTSDAQTALVYQAFWEVFGPADWWTGFSYWRWPQNSTSPSATLQGFLAAGLVDYPVWAAPQAELDDGVQYLVGF